MAESRTAFYGTHATVYKHVFSDEYRLFDIEGAVRSGKTTLCLEIVLALCQQFPGIHGLICRFSDDDTHKLLKPIWRAICLRAGVALTWNSEEGYDELPNRSRVYITGLKTQDATNPYRKFRGLTLGFVYNDQSEELPHGVFVELFLRLSQDGVPHKMLLSPQTVDEDHWIAKEFPRRPRALKMQAVPITRCSTHDNAHSTCRRTTSPKMEDAHPPGTPIHNERADSRGARRAH